MMNNPNKPRETWREFEQHRQDWVLQLWSLAKEQGDDDDFIQELLGWAEAHYDDGVNHTDPDDEYEEFLTRWEEYEDYD